MRKPILKLAAGACLLLLAYWLQCSARDHQIKAAGLPLEVHRVGPENTDDDFFNRPIVTQMAESPEMKAHLQKAEMLRLGVLLSFAVGLYLVARGLLSAVARPTQPPTEEKPCVTPESR